MKKSFVLLCCVLGMVGMVYADCPTSVEVLDHCFWDELGIIDPNDVEFTVQIEGDESRESWDGHPTDCDDYQQVSYDLDWSMNGSCGIQDYGIPQGEWIRIKISFGQQEDVYYYKHPLNSECLNGSEVDIVLNADGFSLHVSDCEGFVLANHRSTTPPTGWYPPNPSNMATGSDPNEITWSHAWENNVPEVSYKLWEWDPDEQDYTYIKTVSGLSTRVTSSGFYTVSALLDGISSQQYPSEVQVTYQSPPAPTNLTANSSSYYLSWNHSWEDDLPNDITYKVYVANTSGGSYSLYGTSNSTTKSYRRAGYFKVYAVLDGVMGPASNIVYGSYKGGFPKITNSNEEVPESFEISQNYPNPFNPSTQIDFQVPELISASIKVYDSNGREVTVLANGIFDTGTYSVNWNGRDDFGNQLSTGLYFAHFKAGTFSKVIKMMYLR
ncbi:T9SS type A sorting domain-containing protein [bacterium]|nr:T9SS type A sorting domain-containing protein [bacterium]